MPLNAGTIWEVRTTGLGNNGGGFFNRLPGTSVDYSQQNGAQLSKADLACVLASVILTSVTGGFTAGMVGNLIQIRAGGVNFVAGFYEIVQWNSVNSVNLDRTPVAAGNGTGGLGEVGGAITSPETFILSGVTGNICYIKSGTYNFAASRTFPVGVSLELFGYDTARTIAPTGNNRPLFALGAFFITTNAAGNNNKFGNIRFTGSGTQLIIGKSAGLTLTNCRFENTNNAGVRYCIFYDVGPIRAANVIDCEFLGTAGADSRGIAGSTYGGQNSIFAFNFFHDLNYGIYGSDIVSSACYLKNTFARMGITSIHLGGGGSPSDFGACTLFNSFYSAGAYHLSALGDLFNVIYGNTFDSAVTAAIRGNEADRMFHIENNDFWNNGASVVLVSLDYDNIGLDPLWVNPAANDFNFGPGSPNIDQALGIRLGV